MSSETRQVLHESDGPAAGARALALFLLPADLLPLSLRLLP